MKAQPVHINDGIIIYVVTIRSLKRQYVKYIRGVVRTQVMLAVGSGPWAGEGAQVSPGPTTVVQSQSGVTGISR